MYLPGDGKARKQTAYKGKEARLVTWWGYLLAQGSTEPGWGWASSSLQHWPNWLGHPPAKVNLRPSPGPSLKSAGLRVWSSHYFPRILFSNFSFMTYSAIILSSKKRIVSTTGFTLLWYKVKTQRLCQTAQGERDGEGESKGELMVQPP